MTKKLHIKTWGCQMNEYDSSKMADLLDATHGYQLTDVAEEADVLLLNTCSIREKAQEKVFHQLGRWKLLKEKNPDLIIGVGGCVASQEGEHIRQRAHYVDIIFGPQTLHRLPEMINSVRGDRSPVVDISFPEIEKFDRLPEPRAEGPTAFVSIMEGCNKYCTYCVVPYTRGEEVSRPSDDILFEIAQLAAQGVREVNLLGQNVNSYGKDLDCGVDFADLLAEIAQLPGQFWLRFMTSHPKDASHKLFDTIAKYPKIAKQFHLPFQSGNDRVLKAMNRHYDSAQYLELVHYGRALMPDLVLTSDVIVGFPGETEEEFEDTIKLIEHVRYDALFTFIFSPRGGTPAAKMEDPTPKEEKNRRFDRLCEVQNRISLEIHQNYIGKTMLVLVDGKDGDQLTARTEGGRLVRMHGDDALIGQFVHAKITGCTTWSLVGELAE